MHGCFLKQTGALSFSKAYPFQLHVDQKHDNSSAFKFMICLYSSSSYEITHGLSLFYTRERPSSLRFPKVCLIRPISYPSAFVNHIEIIPRITVPPGHKLHNSPTIVAVSVHGTLSSKA